MNFKLKTFSQKILADTLTPVGIYLKLRDKYPMSFLLESSDYHGNQNAFTYICCEPIASFKVENEMIYQSFPDGSQTEKAIENPKEVTEALTKFSKCFKAEKNKHNFITNGLFGYTTYDAVKYFEKVKEPKTEKLKIPLIQYHVFKYVIAINHFKNELHIFEHQLLNEGKSKNGEGGKKSNEPTFKKVLETLQNKNAPTYTFKKQGSETSNMSDEDYLDNVNHGISHCKRGDVFQIVLSRRYKQKFEGDDFNVYRALRSVNPSPYLFYFDYGNFKLMGSSPEAQLVVKNRKATIHPIAGTFKRTGNDSADAALAVQLQNDPKENAEHVMLVDLARNDLSRNGTNISVDTFREVQYFSHVIHLVSKVSGDLLPEVSPLQIAADTFPAGTLSGSPKPNALSLIHKYEPENRSYYGGAIGFIGFNGDFNHAIMIRSFLSKENSLYFQAGAGIVEGSVPENELAEVGNKLAALRKALKLAEEIVV